MWFRLAAQFGIPVGELHERMSSAEFTHWVAFYQLEPFGYDVEMWRMGMISATTANAAGPKKGGKSWRPDDFTPKKSAGPRAQSVAEQRAILEAMVKHG